MSRESKLDLRALLDAVPAARARLAALPNWQREAIDIITSAASGGREYFVVSK